MSFHLNLILLNSKTAGKDKIYRTIQYGCKILWYIFWKSRTNKEYIEILKRIESAMSQTRKALRFAKSHDMIHSAFKTIHRDDIFSRYITTAANLNQAIYLLLDNALWLNSIEVIQLKKKNKLVEYSNKFWLFSTLFNLLRNFNEIFFIIQNNQSMQYQEPLHEYLLNENVGTYSKKTRFLLSSKVKKCFTKILKVIALLCLNKQYESLILDTLKNIFDIFLPLSNLKYVNLSPGIEGICGLISSIIGLILLWDSKPKRKN